MNLHGSVVRAFRGQCSKWQAFGNRSQHSLTPDHRERLSQLWVPHVASQKWEPGAKEPRDATTLLEDAGYIRKAYSGIYQYLPLGVKVLDKIERLIDHHMRSVGASKLSLSSFSSEKKWATSGRLANSTEIFQFQDRNKSKWLLAPTHEEEICTLLHSRINLHGQLPVRLYQIGRKYRDEQRPRGGLLRGREFIMKDLYTFDTSAEAAKDTYELVREAYNNFFADLGIPYLEARADSGNMGGNLSHEFHLPHHSGEDDVITCSSCGENRNEEFVPPTSRMIEYVKAPDFLAQDSTVSPSKVRDYISVKNDILIRVLIPSQASEGESIASADVNPYAVKEAMDDIAEVNTGLEEHQVMQKFEDYRGKGKRGRVAYLVDKRVTAEQLRMRIQQDLKNYGGENTQRLIVRTLQNEGPDGAAHDSNALSGSIRRPIDLLKLKEGDECPHCLEGKVEVHKAIEIGHTFHLGTGYTSLLGPKKPIPHPGPREHMTTPLEMGCHGIGVSRLMAAAAACLSPKDAIQWPKIIAPYTVLVGDAVEKTAKSSIADAISPSAEALSLYDDIAQQLDDIEPGRGYLKPDVVLDDRLSDYKHMSNSAIFTGYPIIVMLGRAARDRGIAELICAQAGLREEVPLNNVPKAVGRLLKRRDLAKSSLSSYVSSV
ncbi:Proline--tRNA ligase [Cyphellophora attinorum]|uniref:proline--tRNA ligase n=1 Tax=Cyphellophora attinorum TaxID=1664694 RepID=A0A0N1HHC2_9EURO|nr:Proline--tRNA ligase [Phialophora attinorum]KPI35127.1 Proline--tRNA ligase [Phialophora attinorum]